MDDIPDRAFKSGESSHAQTNLVAYFNIQFPLQQNLSWYEFRLNPKLTPRVIYCLLVEVLPMKSLYRLTNQGGDTGKLGTTTANIAMSTPTLTRLHPARRPSSSPDFQP